MRDSLFSSALGWVAYINKADSPESLWDVVSAIFDEKLSVERYYVLVYNQRKGTTDYPLFKGYSIDERIELIADVHVREHLDAQTSDQNSFVGSSLQNNIATIKAVAIDNEFLSVYFCISQTSEPIKRLDVIKFLAQVIANRLNQFDEPLSQTIEPLPPTTEHPIKQTENLFEINTDWQIVDYKGSTFTHYEPLGKPVSDVLQTDQWSQIKRIANRLSPISHYYRGFWTFDAHENDWFMVSINAKFDEKGLNTGYEFSLTPTKTLEFEKAKTEQLIRHTNRVNEDLLVYKEELEATVESLNSTNRALADREHFLSSIINGASEAIIILNTKRNIVLLNESARKIFGYSDAQLLNLSFLFLVEKKHQVQIRDFLFSKRSLIPSENIFKETITFVKRGGNKFEGLLSIQKLEINGGDGTVIIVTDLSEIKKIERKLEKSEEFYRLLAENTSDLLIVANENLKLEYISPACTKLTGYNQSELMTAGSLDALIASHDVNRINTEINSSLQSQRASSLHIFTLSHKYNLLKYGEASVAYQYNQSDSTKIIVNIRDVTDRVNTEVKLSESEKLYRLIAENTSDLILLTSESFIIEFASPSVQSVFKIDSLVYNGQPLDALLSALQAEGFPEKFNNTTENFKITLTTTRSGVKHYLLSVSKVLNIDGNLANWLFVGRDITELEHSRQALALSEERFRIIIESSQIGICLNDHKSNFEYINPAYSKIYGYQPDELLGKPFTILAPPNSDLSAWRKAYADFMELGYEIPAEWEVQTKDKRTITVKAWAARLYFADGTRKKATFVQDVTEIKQANIRLSQITEELKIQRTALDQCAMVVITDGQGDITYANPLFLQKSEYTAEELIGQNHRLMNSGFHPTSFFSEMWNTITKGKIWRGQIKNLTKNKRTFWVDTTIVPFKPNKNSKHYSYFALRIDVTERKLIQEHLERALSEIQLSEAALFKRTEELITANRVLEEAKEELQVSLERERETREKLAQALDDLKKMQGQLLYTEKMANLGKLTAGIALEINNPINFVFAGIDALNQNFNTLKPLISLFANITSESKNQYDFIAQQANEINQKFAISEITTEIEELIADIRKGAQRTANIVKGLTAFNRNNDNDAQLFYIQETIESALILLSGRLSKISVTKDFDPNLDTINANQNQIAQVFINIIENAIDATDNQTNPKINIRAHRLNNSVLVQFEDNGEGIDNENLPRVFEPFFSTKEPGKGVGLGLWIAYQIIEAHSGNIKIENNKQGGVTTSVVLPI